MLEETMLRKLYVKNGLSVSDIACRLGYSQNKVNYWLQKYGIQKRSIAEAVYLKLNPQGNPFTYIRSKTESDQILFGVGIGLYWGEGNKRSKNSVRLGNTDPRLVTAFIKFLKRIYNIDERKLKFGLQIFSDIPPSQALLFWCKKLHVSSSRFQKVIVTQARSVGTYRHKNEYGVLTVYFNNVLLKRELDRLIENFPNV